MAQPLVFATGNRHKLEEVRAILNLDSVRLMSLEDFSNPPEVEEDGATFLQNATKKALAYAAFTGLLTLADDSGLCVDYLDGAPGVYSSRYAGEPGNGPKNCQKLLEALRGCPFERRTARFTSVLALAKPGKLITTVQGDCHGLIAAEMSGQRGFGYDPIFFSPALQATFGEVSPEEKNKHSHRYTALKQMQAFLGKYFQDLGDFQT